MIEYFCLEISFVSRTTKLDIFNEIFSPESTAFRILNLEAAAKISSQELEKFSRIVFSNVARSGENVLLKMTIMAGLSRSVNLT